MHLPARDKPWDCVNVVCLDDDARGSAAWKQANRAIWAARAAGHVVLSPTAGDAAILGYRDNALREAHLISRRCWRRLRAAEDSIDGKHRFRRALPRGMTAYFYCCPQRLDVGSFVDPGEWGRILRTYDHQTFSNTWIILVRELVYEHVRREQFPTKPSRLDCLLLCMSEDDLSEFHAASGRRLDYRYEVELVNPLARGHLGDLTLTGIKPTDDVAAIERSASLYWQGHQHRKAGACYPQPYLDYTTAKTAGTVAFTLYRLTVVTVCRVGIISVPIAVAQNQFVAPIQSPQTRSLPWSPIGRSRG